MKIALVGPDYFGYAESAANALKQSGHETACFSYPDYVDAGILAAVKYSVLPRLGWCGLAEQYRNRVNDKLLGWSKKQKADLLFVIKGKLLSLETLFDVRKQIKASTAALWTFDYLKQVPEILKIVPCFDRIFLFEKTDEELIPEAKDKCLELPAGYDPLIYHAAPARESRLDLCFVGKLYPNRTALFSALAVNHERFSVVGKDHNWYNIPRRVSLNFGKERAIKKALKNRNVTPDEACRLYQSSRICLNIHNAYARQSLNARTFEILGAKGFQIVDHQAVSRFFDVDKEIVTFSEEEDLKKKIRYYLDHPEERRKIAEAGHRRAAAEHTIAHRMQTVLQAVGA